MRAILDEQLSPQIAVLLRQAGYDVDAVVDREDLVERSDRIGGIDRRDLGSM